MSRTQDLVLARLRLIAMRWSAPQTPWGSQHVALVGDRQGWAGEAVQCGSAAQSAGGAADSGCDEGTGDAAVESQPPELGPSPPGIRVGDLPGGDQDPRPRVWLVLGLGLAIAVVGGVVVLGVLDRPRALLVDPQAQVRPVATGSSSGMPPDPFASPTPPAPVVVHVAGEVRNPGVFRLPAGSRVADAVEAAGGLRRGGSLGGTNLARPLVDGERVEVGGQDGAAPGAGGTAGRGLVNLNNATEAELDALPGIGPVTAGKILAWRAANGRFSVVDELAEVPGIGPKTLAELRPHVRV